MTRNYVLALSVALLALLCGCAPTTAPDTRHADEQAIRDLEIEWSKAAGAKHAEHFASFYADDASVFFPNSPITTGKEAIRKAVDAFLAEPGLSLSFQTSKVDISRSGDLAYSYGTYSMTVNDPKGNAVNVNDKGKYVTVYRKQPDGKWKAVADIFNTDLAPPAAK